MSWITHEMIAPVGFGRCAVGMVGPWWFTHVYTQEQTLAIAHCDG